MEIRRVHDIHFQELPLHQCGLHEGWVKARDTIDIAQDLPVTVRIFDPAPTRLLNLIVLLRSIPVNGSRWRKEGSPSVSWLWKSCCLCITTLYYEGWSFGRRILIGNSKALRYLPLNVFRKLKIIGLPNLLLHHPRDHPGPTEHAL